MCFFCFFKLYAFPNRETTKLSVCILGSYFNEALQHTHPETTP